MKLLTFNTLLFILVISISKAIAQSDSTLSYWSFFWVPTQALNFDQNLTFGLEKSIDSQYSMAFWYGTGNEQIFDGYRDKKVTRIALVGKRYFKDFADRKQPLGYLGLDLSYKWGSELNTSYIIKNDGDYSDATSIRYRSEFEAFATHLTIGTTFIFDIFTLDLFIGPGFRVINNQKNQPFGTEDLAVPLFDRPWKSGVLPSFNLGVNLGFGSKIINH